MYLLSVKQGIGTQLPILDWQLQRIEVALNTLQGSFDVHALVQSVLKKIKKNV